MGAQSGLLSEILNTRTSSKKGKEKKTRNNNEILVHSPLNEENIELSFSGRLWGK